MPRKNRPNPTERTTDPAVTPLSKCPKCKSRMGPIRVYKGTSAGKQSNVGKLCQTCGSGKETECWYTHFHTVAYQHNDAVALVERLELRATGQPIPDHLLNFPLRVRDIPATPSRFQGAKGICKNCGRRGCQTCVDYFCSKCCSATYQKNTKKNIPRPPCIPHRFDAIDGHPAKTPKTPSTAPETPGTSDEPENPSEPAETPQSSSSLAAFEPSPQSPTPASPRSPTPTSPTPSHSETVTTPTPAARKQKPKAKTNHSKAVKTANEPAPITQTAPGNQRGLANPITATWTNNFAEAQRKKTEIQNKKQDKEAMAERRKKTFKLVIYHEKNTEPLVMDLYSATYPNIQLNQFALIMSTFNLTHDSLFDYHESGTTQTTIITIESVLTPSPGIPVVLRIRPSLLASIPVSECIGIDAYLVSPKDSVVKGKKRAAEDILTSPIRKNARTTNNQASLSIPSTPSNSLLSLSSEPLEDLPLIPHTALDSADEVLSAPPGSPIFPTFPVPENVPAPDIPSISPTQTTQNINTTTGLPYMPITKSSAPSFPKDWSVSVWAEGWEEIQLLRETSMVKTDLKLYPSVFARLTGIPGVAYHKATVARYKQVVAKAKQVGIWDRFIALGNVADGSWKNLLSELKHAELQTASAAVTTGAVAPPNTSPATPSITPLAVATISQSSTQPASLIHNSHTQEVTCALCSREICIDTLPCALRNVYDRIISPNDLESTGLLWMELCAGHTALESPSKHVENPDFFGLFHRTLQLRVTLCNAWMYPLSNIFYQSAIGGSYSQITKVADDLGGGYYGPFGVEVVLLALYHSFPLEWVAPQLNEQSLSYPEFILSVLVPTTLTQIIMQDMSVEFEAARRILRESTNWGRVMFPDSDSGDQGDELKAQLAQLASFVPQNALLTLSNNWELFRDWFYSGTDKTASEWCSNLRSYGPFSLTQ